MIHDDKAALIGFGVFVGFVVMLFTAIVTDKVVSNKWEREAISAGVGEYVQDEKEIRFQWKKPEIPLDSSSD